MSDQNSDRIIFSAARQVKAFFRRQVPMVAQPTYLRSEKLLGFPRADRRTNVFIARWEGEAKKRPSTPILL